MQGYNMGRYYPPDASNPPSFNKTSHPLGHRANKISQGILTVRFELPFAVWCAHCKPEAIVGQGVRFNAEKKKVGNYYSTPIWSFRMKHSACGGWWEIRTDPQKSEYTVVEGARRRDYGPDEKGAEADGDLKFLTEAERERRREDAFANLEGKLEEKGMQKKNKERVEELYDKSEVWRDPYDVNARLRKDFRVKRKMWKKEEKHKEGMQEKFSLGLEIADETEADRMRAGLIEFGATASGDESEITSWKPLFTKDGSNEENISEVVSVSTVKRLKSEIAAEKSKKNLRDTLVSNTRAVVDPFSSKNSFTPPKVSLGLLKRKRGISGGESAPIEPPPPTSVVHSASVKKHTLLPTLVGYDSD
ncbi:Protein saf4 [Coniothyrium glycines]